MRGFGYGAWARVNKAVQVGLVAALAAGPAGAETVTVAALGDSLTAGYGLPDGQGFVPQLQAWLDANGVDAEVLNAGVSGDTTAGGLARLDWTLTPEVDALMVALGGNDLLRGIDPATSRANLAAILEGAGERPVLLVGLPAPANYGPAFQQAFDAMYPELAAKYDALLEESFLGPLTAELDARTARGRYMQGDGIHPNREGVKVIVETLGPRVAELVARVAAE
ncbi:arylesterase [Jannaschia sp. GRR-S6-38]|uniref:Arylesterase n=2 Tax=Jannaschia ovalis TaxID=3038773 RepID=A0ABY8LEE6_9RHOB|nr:arylesterase [Jannaschia sp. GRR-S6-38]WGH79688.1 arylesterase [Jannaschia sp. GRR-S6-38]